MNNIYKVIWSKAKNCYVVASEIARSHTKSASGSEKIGGGTRCKLLASLMALSLLCGGLGVASAADGTVNVDVSTTSTTEVYTKEGTESYVQKNTYTKSQTYTQEQVKKLINDLKTGDVATNKANITALAGKTAGLSADGKSLNDMNSVETDALTVKGGISNGAGVTTTLTDIKASMNKADANETAIGKLQATTNGQQTAIDDLKKKTTKIDYDVASDATNVNGMKVGQQVDMGGKNLTDVGTINGIDIGDAQVDMKAKNLTGVGTINGIDLGTVDAQVKTNADAIAKETEDRKAAIGELTVDGKYIKKGMNVSDNLVELDKQAKTNADKIQTNADNIKNNKDEIARVNGQLVKTNDYFNAELGKTNDYFNKELGKTNNHFNTELGKTNAALQATNKRTAGIGRTDTGVEAGNQTVIEDKVYFDQNGNVSGVKDLQTDTIHATGEITSGGLDAKAGDIKTTGKVSAGDISTGTLETTGNATIGGNLDVTGTLNIKDVTAETIQISKSENTTEYKSKGSIIGDGGKLSVSNEKTYNRTNITKESQLNVNEEGTVNWATSKDNETGNVTAGRSEVTADKIKNSVKKTEGGKTFGYEENITAGGKGGTVTDKAGNTTYTKVTATENSFQVQDKDGNKNHQVNTKDSSKTEITNADGKTTTTEQTATDITNTAKDGTITNDAQNIVNTATTMKTTVTGKATESYGELETTVTGQATEKFNGGLDTTVTGAENHTVTGKQTNTVGGGQINNITGGQKNNILTGDQETTVSDGSIINKAEKGNISNTAQNVTNEGTESVTNKVGKNEVKVSKDGVNIKAEDGKKITESVGTASRVVENDKIIDEAGNSTVTTENGKGTTFGKDGSTDTTNIYGDSINTGTIKAKNTTTDKLTAGVAADADGGRLTVDADGVKGSYKFGDYTSKSYILPDTLKSGVDNGKEPTDAGFVGSRTDHYMDENKAKLDETVKDAAGSNVTNKTSTGTVTTIGDGNTTTKTEQGVKDITNTAKDGTIKNDANDIVNNAQETITNKAGTSITNQVNNSIVTTDVDGTTFENKTAAVSDGGTTTTKINGNLIKTGRVDANELGVSDKDGDNTANLTVKAGEDGGVKASAGNGKTTGSLDVKADEVGSSVTDGTGKGSTFKQRIDAIMGNVKNNTTGDQSFHKQTSDVIMDNVKDGENSNNRTQTKTETKDIITDKDGNSSTTSQTASENKTYLTDKDRKNTNSTIDTAKGYDKTIKGENGETSTKQDATDITHTAKDGTIKNDAKDIVNNASNSITDKVGDNTRVTTSTSITDTVDTANRKIEDGKITDTAGDSTVTTVHGKGTTFTKTGSTAYREGGPTDTNISGNTITTGKVTMDYADVMKNLGVHGNAKVDHNLEVGGTLDVTQRATFHDDVDIKKNLSVDGNATIKGDVTASSYKVGGKTYIDANGINANNQKITNVADGSISEGSKDAVNGGQLYGVKTDLEHKVDKVGANAAAMANLHPMEFDPDSKWNIAAAMGNYGSETATAIGAFYRPNEDVMVNFSTAFGTGENMVGGGVSVRLGKGSNKLSREESNALKDQVDDLTARMDALLSVLNPNMSKDFPDVPENHWAYEAVSRLAGNDIVQGYPDGEFHGERTMTRYEMAEIIYNALSRGAEAERELVEEFKPELQAMAASEKATAERAEG